MPATMASPAPAAHGCAREAFEAALVECEKSYELAPSYKILNNTGLIHRQLNDYRALAPRSAACTLSIAPTAPSNPPIVWDESDNGAAGFANPVIWTSPYATTQAALVRRKVALYTDSVGYGGADMVANAGVVVNVVAVDEAPATRLSDGMGWSITAEPGDAFVQPAWVDDNEVWLIIGPKTSIGNAMSSGIMRLTRSSLGAPTVPRGF